MLMKIDIRHPSAQQEQQTRCGPAAKAEHPQR
jgi:hypothetical protein